MSTSTFEEHLVKHAVRSLVLAAAPVVALGVTGCAIHEQTQSWYTPTNGMNAEAGEIGLRNVLVVSDDSGATVVASLANRGSADRLLDVTIGGTEPRTGLGRGIEIPASGVATLGSNGEQLLFSGVDAEPGHLVDVEFRFETAPRATVQALVLPAEDIYADALPTP